MPKILWHSNSPMAGTGYGTQTLIFTRLLKEAGWDVVISTNYGLKGAQLNFNGIKLLPGSTEQWGNDILSTHYEVYKPDVLFALTDSWILNMEMIGKIPLAVWTPVDHQTLPPAVEKVLHQLPYPVAMSRHGEGAMRDVGLDPFYIPHGVVTSIFQPKDRNAARKKLKFEDNDFVVSMVAANKGTPSRKSFDVVVKAWAQFIKKHPKAVLYLHTFMHNTYNGLEFPQLLEFYGIPENSIKFPNIYDYVQGSFPWEYLVDVYNASDVMLLPSKGEGFGVPVIEAHACGCPTIVTDFTAQSELNSHYKILVDPLDGCLITGQYAEQAVVLPSQVLAALELAYENKDDKHIREEARESAMPYDAMNVLNTYMLPAFETMMTLNNVRL